MYSRKVAFLLKEKKISVGDTVKVESSGNFYEGVLMPRIETGDTNCIVLKLENGYNIGVKCTNAKITKTDSGGSQKKVPDSGALKFRSKKPSVSLITTGGTITSKIDYKTGGVTSLTSPEELLQKVPQLADFVNMRIESPFTTMSESLTHEHWQALAKVVAKELKHNEGVIVTQGTDTLHYTAAALSFMLRGLDKPVIVTGAQRSTDRGSSDGFMNLVCSARIAISDMAGVGVCMHGTMNDDYCMFTRGTKVRKMHTSRRDAFRPINDIPLAKIWPDGRIEKLQEVPKRGKLGAKADTLFEEKVAIIKSYPGCAPGIIDYYVGNGYRGLVLGATGIGQLPTYGKNSWLKSIKKATEKGVLVCGAAETLYGRMNPNVYTEGRLCREAGVFYLEDMPIETAYVKLGWVLGHTKSVEKAKKMMLTNYAGEISKRTLQGTFLY
ncbi:MAG: Glu-tRNA(Gln) amidotransferase subunit GatD [Candidatus Aenigmarchaeota archaeon]|nr:Glu-tRNA(Gln) amidotransferase subunit GatD [Candidatus Aenigmarchaeota archaeon]